MQCTHTPEQGKITISAEHKIEPQHISLPLSWKFDSPTTSHPSLLLLTPFYFRVLLVNPLYSSLFNSQEIFHVQATCTDEYICIIT